VIEIGDCRAIMRRWIGEGVKVQTCVTSPPYWGLRDYGVEGQLGLEKTPEEYVARTVEVFALVRELLADDGTLWLNLGDSYAAGGNGIGSGKQLTNVGSWMPRKSAPSGLKPKDLVGIPWRVAFALQADGWYLRSDIIWAKPNPMPESVRDRPTKAHEYVFLLSKSERYFYDADAVAEAATFPDGPGNISPVRGAGHEGYEIRGNLHNIGPRETRNRRTVWTVSTQPFSGAHFAVMPEALVEPCILAGSRPGDTVFDPFMGSGTVARVATRLGREHRGCEINPAYAELQRERTRVTMGLAL
jgi:DNA modification methylase